MRLSVMMLLLVSSLASAAGVTPAESVAKPATERTDTQATLAMVAGYRRWTRVNPKPAVFHSRIAIQCAAPTPGQRALEASNPHRDKFVTVYVNDIGRAAMMEQRQSRFPIGSVIVKEKLSTKESVEPELLTVMLKREAGYNPGNGDWKYIVLDGSAKLLKEQGRLQHCQDCHMADQDNDFVSRNYLPDEVRQRLR